MVKPGTPIVLRETVPKSQDTDKRQNTAQVILERWPEEKKEIADEADVSRTHVDNVLESHFKPLLEDKQYATHYDDVADLLTQLRRKWVGTQQQSTAPEINPPQSDSPEYVSGYMQGYLDCWNETQGLEIDASEA